MYVMKCMIIQLSERRTHATYRIPCFEEFLQPLHSLKMKPYSGNFTILGEGGKKLTVGRKYTIYK